MPVTFRSRLGQMFAFLHSRLWVKLFLSYLLVILAGIVVLGVVVGAGIPAAYNRQLAPMMVPGAMQGPGHMGQGQGGPPAAQLLIGFRRGVMDALLTAGLAAFGVAFIASLIVSRRVVAPLQAMTVASQHITEGHYNERVPAPGGELRPEHDELARMAVNFNQMAERLEQTETMRRQLIADVAHELRTPLTAIKGSMEGLIDGVLPAEPETYEQIHREADRLQRLVLDLEELSRVEAGIYQPKLRTAAVNHLVNATVARLGRQYEEKGVVLETDIPQDLPPVQVDEDRIGQVLTNLVGNALQYTPQGGRVRVIGSRHGDEVLLKVVDTGIGIPAEHLPHLFDRFYRVDKSRSRVGGGSGIGLTIARYWVEAHGGQIGAESRGAGAGSTFWFTLPVTKEL